MKGYHQHSVEHSINRMKGFRQTLALNDSGAKAIYRNSHEVRNPKLFDVGNAVFTKKQVLEGRRRFIEVHWGKKVSKKQVGL